MPCPCENRPPAGAPQAAFPTQHGCPTPSVRSRATTQIRTMDIERINAIGNRIADLTERTNALRGYL